MRKAGLVVYSALLWTFFVITSIIMFAGACIVWLLTRCFDRRLVILHLFSAFWGSFYIWFNPLWRVRVRGRRKLPWRRPAMLVSNHQSMIDILVLYQLFAPYKWVSKKENFSIPIIGWLMRLNDYVEIERGSSGSYARFMRKSIEFLQKGNSLLMFPEGTRYPGGELGPFRDGAFRMAHETGVDIIPIVMDGTARALPKKGAILTGFSNIRVNILDPVPYGEFASGTPQQTMDHVRGIMSEAYARLHQQKTAR
jgi:1-acyl-sn-glycerol-3-phosphate acyltransferase